MALYKRNGIWWVDISEYGRRIRQSTRTEVKRDAQRVHDRLKDDLWKAIHLKEKPRRTWIDAVIRWLNESKHKRSLQTDRFHLAWMDPYLRNSYLDEIDQDLVEYLAKEKEKTDVKHSTINRMLEVLRAILNKAQKEWGWIESTPPIRMRKVENKRIRWLSKLEAKRLLNELPPHLKAMAAFTLATGLRQSNVTKLKWHSISFERKHALIHPDESKTNRAIPVPLNDDALNILLAEREKHPIFVFTYNSEPVQRCNNHAWRKALKRAEIQDFTWHDLRHTWASWHVQNGTTLQELQYLGGWTSFEMVLRYAHLSSEHLRSAADNIQNTFYNGYQSNSHT